jgi:hypothetical protein
MQLPANRFLPPLLTSPSFCGLVILRFPFEAIAIEIRQALEKFIDQVNLPEIIGATVIVDQNKFRIRKR